MGFFKTLVDGWSLARIMAELSQPVQPDSLPERIYLCEQALQLVSRDANPPLWSLLQHEPDTNLSKSRLGYRSARRS
jgi:hypothetical protein